MKLSRKVSAASLAVAIAYGTLTVAPAAKSTQDAEKNDATTTIALQKCNGSCNGRCKSSADLA